MRADRRTRTEAEEEIYSDFDISFKTNPVTGALIRVTNDQAVKQSIRNIILASRGEWAHHPELGSKIYHLLFEPANFATADVIKEILALAIKNNEPRVTLNEVRVAEDIDRNGYDITIVFTTRNSTTPFEFKEFLKRIR